ncbi:hypothetical protein [Pseudomonas moraviensis]|uniref:hypothetical protein n=1 Tax=Pseudomonas moraviensis TaxID=321662 RepID=UPI0009369646|nr:hypothetical protein [Pseudomonas moraviensis]OJT48394.1 hypothetical protein BSZ28_26320 [Pseudomonas moraviensis]
MRGSQIVSKNSEGHNRYDWTLRNTDVGEVIDWSPGRLACIEAQGADVETLAEIIRDLAEAAWDEHITFVDASYEEMGKA